jgi:DNA polymerase III subunit delta'
MVEFLDIAGQDAALGRLQQAMGSQRLPHALLFAGPVGVGRKTAAVALAKALLCDQPASRANQGRLPDLPDDFSLKLACGRCPSCRAMDADTHVDFHRVYKELARFHEDAGVRGRVMQDLGIDVIRDFLIAPAGRAAGRGRGKVFMVSEAELLSEAAQNALLKTLEEPPPGVTIILIADQAAGLLPTTLSRCWAVNFRPLPMEFVRDRLRAAGVSESEADFWAAYTAGSLGEALRLATQDMYRLKCDLVERLAQARQAGSTELAAFLAETAEALAARAVAEFKKTQDADLSKLLASRRAAAELLGLVASVFRDAITLAAGADRAPVHADQPAAPRVLTSRFGLAELARAIEELDAYETLLWRNANPRLIWDNVALTVTGAAPLRL